MNDIIKGLGQIGKGLYHLIVILVLWNLVKLAWKGIKWLLFLPINGLIRLAGFNPKTPFLKSRLIAMFLICGIAWCPMTMIWTMNAPVRAHYLLGKIGLGFLRAYNDVKTVTKVTYDRVIPKTIRNGVDRYNLDAVVNMPLEVASKKKAPMEWRITKMILSPVKAVGSFFGLGV